MHIAELRAKGFRRFHDLTINLPGTPRLVVVCGPNGNGKSSLFDAMRVWHGQHDGRGIGGNNDYWLRPDNPNPQLAYDTVTVRFHEAAKDVQAGSDAGKKAIYVRSAYRNDPEFATASLSRPGPLLDAPTTPRMIDNEGRVSENYMRMAGQTLVDIYSGAYDTQAVGEVRERYVGRLRDALGRVFPHLQFVGPGDPLTAGTFHFRKGTSTTSPIRTCLAARKRRSTSFSISLSSPLHTTTRFSASTSQRRT